MVALCVLDGELESSVNKLDMNARVSWSVVGWNFEHGQLALMEGELLDGLGFEVDSLSNPDQLISNCELKCGHLLAVMVDGDSNGAQPGVVIVGVVRNKESIHLELVIADQVEDGVALTLEGVAEQSSSGQPDGKMWVRANASLFIIVCNQQNITNSTQILHILLQHKFGNWVCGTGPSPPAPNVRSRA